MDWVTLLSYEEVNKLKDNEKGVEVFILGFNSYFVLEFKYFGRRPKEKYGGMH